MTRGHKLGYLMSDRKEREFKRREQEILQAALELFADEQWEKVTVAQIAQHADIGKGTVYKHFASKEEIYARMILDYGEEMLAVFKDLLSGDNDPASKLRQLLEHCFHRFSEDSACMRLHFHCKQRSFRERLSEPLQQQFAAREQEFMAVVAPVLEQGMAEGYFMQRPLCQAFIGLEAIFDGTLLMIRNEEYLCMPTDQPAMDQETFIAEMVSFMLSTLTGRIEPVKA